jgi:prevent-host-death family protein
MSRTVTATDAKARILSLLDEVAAGDVIEITKHGRVVARLVSAGGAHALEGKVAGIAMTAVEEQDLFTTEVAWNLP